MQCPFCKVDNDRVIDSRSIGDGNAIRRRRHCLACGKRFTTYERIEVAPRVVVKKDSRREAFSRDKILGGMIRACEKRNISLAELESVASRIEAEVYEEHDSELSSGVVGEKVSEALKELDHVAFVRFASVYREFKDVTEFLRELMPLVRSHLKDGDLQQIDPRAPAENKPDGAASESVASEGVASEGDGSEGDGSAGASSERELANGETEKPDESGELPGHLPGRSMELDRAAELLAKGKSDVP